MGENRGKTKEEILASINKEVRELTKDLVFDNDWEKQVILFNIEAFEVITRFYCDGDLAGKEVLPDYSIGQIERMNELALEGLDPFKFPLEPIKYIHIKLELGE